MLLRTDGGLRTVGVRGSELLAHGLPHLVAVVCQIQVILLIHGLQFGMESADDHVLETVALDLCPVLNLVGGDIFHITGDIVRGEGVRPLSADGGHQLVVFVGDEILGCELRHGVNLVIGLLAGLCVGELTIGLVALLYLVEQRGLCLMVVRTKLIGALEHEVLQIVCQTSGLRRIVLRTSPHGDKRLQPRLLIIH